MTSTTGNILFIALVAVTLGITARAGRRNTSLDSHYVASGRVSARQNGLAVIGDAVTAATLLGTTGAIALAGYGSIFLALFSIPAFCIALLLIAEPLRNLGTFTLADVVEARFRGRSVRLSIALSSTAVSVLYMVSQYIAGAVLIGLLFDLPFWAGAALIGTLTTLYSLVGGMIAATWIQIVKAVLMLAIMILLLVLVLARFDFDVRGLFDSAAASPLGDLTAPKRGGTADGLNQISLAVGSVLGVIGLPHVMVRFLTVESTDEVRRSFVTIVSGLFVVIGIIPLVAFGGAALLGPDVILARSPTGNLMLPQLADLLGGDVLLSSFSAVAVSTILASVAGMVVATTGALSHDLYARGIRRGGASTRDELRFVRGSTVVLGVVVTGVSLAARDQNIAVLANVAIAVAASANFPALMAAVYARRATAQGVLAAIVAGLISAVVVIVLGPTVSGPDAPIPLDYPALISLPVSLLALVTVSWWTRPRGQQAIADAIHFEALRFKALTGRRPEGAMDA